VSPPISKFLVLNSDRVEGNKIIQGLSVAASATSNPLGINFVGCESVDELLAALLSDGLVQGVIIAQLSVIADQKHKNKVSHASAALDLVKNIHQLRPELNVFIYIKNKREEMVVDKLFSQTIDGYFYSEEKDFSEVYRRVNARLSSRAATPFLDALKRYVNSAKDSWHTPGHSGGDSLIRSPWVGDFYHFMGSNCFSADLSVSVPVLDSLLDPQTVIRRAQELAARAFGAEKTFFATNGTSTANKVIFQTLLAPGDKLLLDRNCHKSVHHGVILSGAFPIYLNSSLNSKFGIFGPVSKETIYKAIEQHADAKALIITSCTYDGFRYDLRPIVDKAHQAGIKVVVDEAWYGHARFHPILRPTAMESGADYATQSTHKMLSAFSQASMIHVNDPEFDEHYFRENFNMHASTSPQYTMIASLDVARKQMSMEGYYLLKNALSLADELRASIEETQVFKVLDLNEMLPEDLRGDGIKLDPTKLTVDISHSGYTVDELQRILFEQYHIQVEKTTFNTLTLLITIGTTHSKMFRLHDALMRIAKSGKNKKRFFKMPTLPEFSSLKVLPRDAFFAKGESIAITDSEGNLNQQLIGRVCADQIVPYPPGIPILVPGQLITREILNYLGGQLASQKHSKIHGIFYAGYVPYIRLVNEKELKLQDLPPQNSQSD